MKERGLRGAAAGGLALLGAAVLVAGCQTETRTVGPDAVEAAARGGWAVSGGAGGDGGGRPGGAPSGEGDSPHDALFDPPPRDPSDVVQVPVEAYAPVDRFFDNEGFLLGDRVEVDCSAEPFMARLIALAYADANGKYVVREEGREGDVHVVRLRNEASGVNYQSNLVPKATFGSQRGVGAKEDPRTGEVLSVNVRPFFEIVGTEEIVIRFHMNTSRDLPVFFRAVAKGSPSALHPDLVKDCVYMNANRRAKVRGPSLTLALEIRRGADGRWAGTVRDPVGER